MKIKKYIIGFLVGAFGMLNVNAAKLEFDGDRSISYNGTGTVDIKLNSEGDEVKKIEFVLNYDTNFIIFVRRLQLLYTKLILHL